MKEKTEVKPNAANPPITLSVSNNQAVTNSKEVARVFEKQHNHVLRDIRELDIPADFRESNFGPNKIKVLNNPAGEETESYDMTKDGFTLLAMGYTGAKAMKFKIAYKDAFNKMEAALLNQSTCAALTPAQQRDVQVAIAERVYASGTVKGDKIVSSSQFQALHRSVKNRFHVGSYKDIPASCFDELMAFIAECPIETHKAIEAPAAPIDEKALALRLADVILKQVQPQIIRYEKTSDIGDLIVNMQKDIKDMAIRMKHEMLQVKHELVRELKPVATITHYDNIPMPREQWQKTWDCLSDTHSELSRAVEQFRVDVTNVLPQKRIQDIPKGEDVLEFVRLHYSNMETMARQINVLAEVLMWKSPKVAAVNMSLGKPGY